MLRDTSRRVSCARNRQNGGHLHRRGTPIQLHYGKRLVLLLLLDKTLLRLSTQGCNLSSRWAGTGRLPGLGALSGVKELVMDWPNLETLACGPLSTSWLLILASRGAEDDGVVPLTLA